LAVVALTLFARDVLLVLTTQQYAEAYWIIGILAFNFVLTGLGYIANVGPGIVKNNRAYGIATIASAILLVILNMLLVPRFGIEGAAVATALSQVLIPVIVFSHSQSLYPIKYNFRKTIMMLGSAAVVGFGTLLFLNEVQMSDYGSIAAKLLILLLYATVLILSLKNTGKIFRNTAG
jgi:O-antigen/teichoic acid export membrane protein